MDEHGQKWIFKPSPPWLASVDVAAADLQRKLGQPGPATHQITIGGQTGSIQALFTAKPAFPPHTFDATKVHELDVANLQQEHVVDWLLGNNDSHSGNFLTLPNGQHAGIDKTQSFKHYNSDQIGHQSTSPLGGDRKVYEQLYKDYAAGKDVSLSDPATSPDIKGTIDKAMAIPDDKIREMFRPYAEGAVKSGKSPYSDPEKLLDAIVTRKNNLAKDFQGLFDKAQAERDKKLGLDKAKAAELEKVKGLVSDVPSPKSGEKLGGAPSTSTSDAVKASMQVTFAKNYLAGKLGGLNDPHSVVHDMLKANLSKEQYDKLLPDEKTTINQAIAKAKIAAIGTPDFDKLEALDNMYHGIPNEPKLGSEPSALDKALYLSSVMNQGVKPEALLSELNKISTSLTKEQKAQVGLGLDHIIANAEPYTAAVAQFHKDRLDNAFHTYNADQVAAIHEVLHLAPAGTYSSGGPAAHELRLKAYQKMSGNSYAMLAPAYKKAIAKDTEGHLTVQDHLGIPKSGIPAAGPTPAEVKAQKAQSEADQIKANLEAKATQAQKDVKALLGPKVTSGDEQIIGDAYKGAWKEATKDAFWYGAKSAWSKQQALKAHPDLAEFNTRAGAMGSLAAAAAVAQAHAHAMAEHAAVRRRPTPSPQPGRPRPTRRPPTPRSRSSVNPSRC